MAHPRLKFNILAFWFGYSLCRLTMKALLRVKLTSAVPTLPMPAIVAGKHSSYWDIPLVASAVRRFGRRYPCFEMGSFEGYPILGRMTWLLKRFGGFPVMRPKDVLRIRHLRGADGVDPREKMRRVNDEARMTRREVLRAGKVLCYFPEGARDPRALRRFRSQHEVAEAKEAAAEGLDVHIVPAVLRYGKKPRRVIPFILRRSVEVELLEPIPVAGREPRELLEEVRSEIEKRWAPPPRG